MVAVIAGPLDVAQNCPAMPDFSVVGLPPISLSMARCVGRRNLLAGVVLAQLSPKHRPSTLSRQKSAS